MHFSLTDSGTFRAVETVADVYQFVRGSLADPAAPFTLQLHMSPAPLEHASLTEAGLLPAAVLIFSTPAQGPFLRPDLASGATSM